MPRIGLISDTHGFLDDKVFKHFDDCDEIWHAGDVGGNNILGKLSEFKPLRAVYGNIDGGRIRQENPEDQLFEIEGLKVWMTHIGGYPGRYDKRIREKIKTVRPDIFISGHSHILKVMRDKNIPHLLHFNPGAAGKHGFQKIRTIMKFDLNDKKISEVKVIELGPRVEKVN